MTRRASCRATPESPRPGPAVCREPAISAPDASRSCRRQAAAVGARHHKGRPAVPTRASEAAGCRETAQVFALAPVCAVEECRGIGCAAADESDHDHEGPRHPPIFVNERRLVRCLGPIRNTSMKRRLCRSASARMRLQLMRAMRVHLEHILRPAASGPNSRTEGLMRSGPVPFTRPPPRRHPSPSCTKASACASTSTGAAGNRCG